MAINPYLDVNALSVHFGGLKAVSDVSLQINTGELIGLIGPNGAGKTTFFNAITGLCHLTGGQVLFNGVNLTNKPAHFICRQGLARTFQNIRLFKSLTVLENLLIAYHQNMNYSILGGILKSKKSLKQEAEALQQAMEVLKIVGLDCKAQENAVSLPYGEQRKLEIARALVTKPSLLLLDEPAAGMNPNETNELIELIHRLQSDFKLTILLIEHDMNLVMSVCERIYVLDYGILIAEGTGEEIRENPKVIEAYLGEEIK